MTGRLRDRISDAWTAVSTRLSRPHRGGAAVKGCVKNVIVVKPGDPAFREAVFFLRDDYFSSSRLSRALLLAQARDAARRYTDSVAPPRKSLLPTVIISVLITSGIFAALILTGTI